MNPKMDALSRAHQQLRKAVPVKRSEARRSEGDLHALGREVFVIWDRMQANGESFQQRCDYLAGILRQILCYGREWKFLCQQCDDYGLILSECDGSSACGRPRRHLPHTFGTPCVCSKGRAFERPAKDVHAEDFTSAGKTKKPQPRGFTRFGA